MPKLRVLIDGYNLGLEQGTGVATYARTLSHSVHALGHEVGILYGGRPAPWFSDLMREIAFFDTHAGAEPAWLRRLRQARQSLIAPMGFGSVRVPITGAVVAEQFKARMPYFDSIWNSPDLFPRAHRAFRLWRGMSRAYCGFRPDIVHWTYPLPLYTPLARNIYTLHDLVPLRLPYTTLDDKRRYFRLCRQVVRRASHIITVSESSRNDIINLLGARPERVTNTYQSVSIPDKYRLKRLDVVKREVEGTFGLQMRGYFLFYGAIEPKKNVGRLIEAYLGSGVDTPLVIVGTNAWKHEQEVRLLYDDHVRSLIRVGDETRVKRRVIRLDYVSFPLLVSLIRGAKATMFPSLYEGFGLPVLESMLLGTPVLTSNTSSLPEVAGDAACLVNPYDTQSIAQAIRALDEKEGYRAELSAKGVRRAQLFSGAAYESKLQGVYDAIG